MSGNPTRQLLIMDGLGIGIRTSTQHSHEHAGFAVAMVDRNRGSRPVHIQFLAGAMIWRNTTSRFFF